MREGNTSLRLDRMNTAIRVIKTQYVWLLTKNLNEYMA